MVAQTSSLVNALNVLAGALSGGSASTSRSVQSQEQRNELSHMLSLNANQAALEQLTRRYRRRHGTHTDCPRS